MTDSLKSKRTTPFRDPSGRVDLAWDDRVPGRRQPPRLIRRCPNCNHPVVEVRLGVIPKSSSSTAKRLSELGLMYEVSDDGEEFSFSGELHDCSEVEA